MKSEIIRTVIFNNHSISYTLVRKNVKNLNLRIHTDKSVHISAPKSVSYNKIDEFVLSKGEYILKAFEHFERLDANNPDKIEYINNAKIPYLGQKITLSVILCDTPHYKLCGENLKIFTKNTETANEIKQAVDAFYSEQNKIIFSEIIKELYPPFHKMGINYPMLRIKNMKSRWGSCLVQKGIITLNSSLIYVPLTCIEYVALHEYCHFIHPNHSKNFYNLVAQFMPDWKERKKLLDNFGIC